MLWLLLAVFFGAREAAESATFQRVVQGGFGFTPNIIVHPATANLIYSRTDVGGAYRWNSSSNSWTPITDNFDYTTTNSTGGSAYQIESIAVDPSNTNVVYIFNGDVYRSATQGGNWTRLNLNKFSGGNNDFRNVGERLAVDPANSQIIYVGTRSNGLWCTTNQGSSWNSVSGVPAGNGGYGVGFVVFDSSGGMTNGGTRNIYAGVLGNGLYLSTDGGNSWNAVSGGPANSNYYPIRAAMVSSNRLMVTYSCSTNWSGGNNQGYVYRCSASTSLQNITPGNTQRDYCGIAVDFNNSNHVVVNTFPGGLGTYGNFLFESQDAGNTWTTRNPYNYTRTDVRSTSPWGSDYWMSGILFEPGDSTKLWISDGFSVWRSDNFTLATPNFVAKVTNHEECVVFSLLCLPSGNLLSGVEDRSGFLHTNFNTFPPEWDTNLSRPMTVSMDYCQTNPSVIYRVGGEPFYSQIGVSDIHAKSLDGGVTWTNINLPGTNQVGWGAIAVSATNANRVVWIPVGVTAGYGGGVFWSADGGQTWTNATGGPAYTYWSCWSGAAKELAADRVNGSKFYIFGAIDYTGNYQGLFYRSTDGGKTWTQLQNYGQYLTGSLLVKAAPGIEGLVWIFDGTNLRKSSDSGTTFQTVNNIQNCQNFAFGAPMPGSTNPMVYAVGQISSQPGIYMSSNLGATWTLMQSSAGMGLQAAVSMDADKSTYGIVYIGTGGRGVIRVSIASTTTALNASANPSTYGSSVTFTATIQTNGVTATAATSNIVFQVDGVPVATNAVTSGQATYGTASLTAAAHTIVATYQGDNYFVSSATNLTQSVNMATPVVTWNNPANIIYGTPLSGTQLNATSGGVVGSFVYTPANGAVLGAGNGQTLSVQFTPTDTTNYTSATNTVSVAVGQVSLGVTANNDSKTYNGVGYINGNGVTYSGFVNGDTAGSLGGTLSFGGTSQNATNAGTYSIVPSGLNSSNYAISYTNGTLTINTLGVTVTADTQTKVYGTADPALTYTYTPALAAGDSFSGALIRTSGESVGNYVISQGNLSLSTNYTLTFIGTNLVITPATLVVTANNTSKNYGQTVTFVGTEFTTSGLTNGDTVTSATITSAGATNTATVAGSTYPIVISAATGTGLGNYNISYVNGALTVNPASTFVGVSSSKNPSGYTDSVSYTATLPADATGNVVFSSPSGSFSTNTVSGGSASSSALTTLPRGTNVITVAYLGDSNYLGSTNSLNQVVTNHPPVATDATYYRAKGLSLKIAITNLLIYATDVDGDTITLQSVGAGLTNATIMTDSTYVYYLPGTGAGSNDNDVVSYVVNDGFGGTATANILVNVYSAAGPAQMSIPTNGVVNIIFHGIPNYTYIVQTTTNLSLPWWTLSTNTASTNGSWQFTDPNVTNAQQYYRSAQP